MSDILFAEQTLQFDADVNYENVTQLRTDMSENIIVLTPGNVYTVIWDGTKYECVAKNVNFFNGDEVEIGNTNIVGIEDDSDEPFVLGYSPSMQMNLIYASGNAETHTVAIYRGTLEEEKVGANIVLYDRNGNPVTYEDIETVTFNTDVDEVTATYTFGTAVNDVPVDLDLSDGDQTVKATAGELIKSAVVKKPETLLPENIKKGVEIAGVTGELIGEGVSKTVELDFSEGNQTVLPDVETLLSEVVIQKPEGLVPENIASGMNIAGVVGNAALNDFDDEDENLKYMAYHLDTTNKEVLIRNYSLHKKNIDSGLNSVVIPNKLGGYPVAIETGYIKPDYSNGFFKNHYLKSVDIGEAVRYVNGDMGNVFAGCSNLNSPICIPEGVTNIHYLLWSCWNFNQQVNIPNSVVNAACALGQCNNFNQPILIGDNLENAYRMFYGATRFNQPVSFKNNVANMSETFINCFAFNQPINIPDSVTNIASGFYDCRNLNSDVTIGAGVTNARYAFYNCKNFAANIRIKAKNILNVYGIISSKNNSKRTNIFVYAGSNTEKRIRNTSITGTSFSWINDVANNRFYNEVVNVYVYNNL